MNTTTIPNNDVERSMPEHGPSIGAILTQFAEATVTSPHPLLVAVITAEATPLWWLSFIDRAIVIAPEGEQTDGGPGFLGAAVVEGDAMADAFTRTHELGINPGGSVQVSGPIPADAIDAQWCDRLLSYAEALSIPDGPIDEALSRFAPDPQPVRDGICPGCGFASIPLLCSKCGTVRPGRNAKTADASSPGDSA